MSHLYAFLNLPLKLFLFYNAQVYNEISKRIVTVTTTEAVIAAFGAAVGAGTYIAANVRYMRLTNKDDSNFIYLVCPLFGLV